MGNVTKKQPDKFKKLVLQQDKPKRPATLGEPTLITDWDKHINACHRLVTFAKIAEDKSGQKQAYVTTPNPGTHMIAVKEMFCGYHYVWILSIQDGTDRILFRVNSGEIDFVTWDIPEEAKAEEIKAE